MKDKTFEGTDVEGNIVEFTVVATFDLNGRHYLFYTDMNNMYVGYYECKKVKSITNIDEYNLLFSLYEQLKVNNFEHKFYDYGYTFYNGKNYKMIYDTFDRRRYFFELIDGRYVEVTGDTLDYFNEKFNSEVLSLQDSADTNNIEEYNNKSRRVNVKLFNNNVMVTVKTNINFDNLPLKQNNLEVDIKHFIEKSLQIKELIIKNNLIDIKDKAFYLSLDELYNDNYKYMNLNILKKVIPDLTVLYEKDNQKKYNTNENTMGQYFYKDYKIILYNHESFNYENYETPLHEYIHALSNTGLTYDNPDGLALTEGITELIISEYLESKNKYIGSYRKQQVYAKMLCEILGKDVVLESFFKHDYNILIDELNKYTKSEEESINLIRLINDEHKYENELGSEAYIDKITIKNKIYKEIKIKIDTIFSKMFEVAKDYSMNEDIIMCSYLDQIRKGNRANYEYYNVDSTYYTEVQKFYINSEKINDIAKITYYYSPQIEIKPNKEKFVLQSDSNYLCKYNNKYYNNIPEFILVDSMDNIVNEENRIMKQKNL